MVSLPFAPTIRAAVVGAGYLGRFHAEKLKAAPDVELVAVVDVDAGRAHDVAAALDCQALTDHRALYGRVDAACVVVPTLHHHPVARDLLEAGIDVLVEKPVTRTVVEAEDLIEAADRLDLVFQVGHLERFNPAVETLVDRVDRPSQIKAVRRSPYQERGTDVDVILDLMIHDLDLLLGLVDAPIQSIQASGLKVRNALLDIADARIEFADGTQAHLSANRVSDCRVRSMHIDDENAVYAVDLDRRTLDRRSTCQGDRFGSEVLERIAVPRGDALEKEIRAFVDCVRQRTSPRVDGADGLRALELAIAIREQILAAEEQPPALPVHALTTAVAVRW